MSVVEVVFEKLPIYNKYATRTVVTVIKEIDSLLRVRKIETKWLSWKDEDTTVVMTNGDFFLVDHQSGSHRKIYYQMLILGRAWEGEEYKDEENDILIKNAKVYAVESYNWRKLGSITEYLRKRGIELPDVFHIETRDLFYTTIKLWYLEKKTGLVRSLLAPKSTIDYEKIYAEVLGKAKKLSLDYLLKLREEIDKIIKEKEEERMSEIAARL